MTFELPEYRTIVPGCVFEKRNNDGICVEMDEGRIALTPVVTLERFESPSLEETIAQLKSEAEMAYAGKATSYVGRRIARYPRSLLKQMTESPGFEEFSRRVLEGRYSTFDRIREDLLYVYEGLARKSIVEEESISGRSLLKRLRAIENSMTDGKRDGPAYRFTFLLKDGKLPPRNVVRTIMKDLRPHETITSSFSINGRYTLQDIEEMSDILYEALSEPRNLASVLNTTRKHKNRLARVVLSELEERFMLITEVVYKPENSGDDRDRAPPIRH